jgi:hypothetical protein
MNNNNNNITINNLNKTNFSYDNSEEQLQVGVKIILNAFENKIAFFEKEMSNLKEALRIKDEKVSELESILENVTGDLKKCQEFNTNLIEENKYLVDLTEKLNDDNSKLSKFKNSILSSLQLDSNFILNQDYNNINLNNSANLNSNNNNQFANQNTDEYEKSRLSPNLLNSQNSGNSNYDNMQNFFPNKNCISFNGKDQENNNNNAYLNKHSTRNINPNNKNMNFNNFNSFNNPVNLNSNSNMNSMLSPLNNYDNFNDSLNPNLLDSGTHVNEMIMNLQNKMKVNSKINKSILFNNQGIDRRTISKNRNNNEDNKDCLSEGNSNLVGNNRSSKISEKISKLKNKFKTQKYEKFNTADTLTTLYTQNSDGNCKKENIDNTINLAKEKSGKSNKYQQSIKFFNEARVILKKEEFDELVFLIKSINQGKVTSEEFESKINLLIGNHTSLIRDLPNVINLPA